MKKNKNLILVNLNVRRTTKIFFPGAHFFFSVPNFLWKQVFEVFDMFMGQVNYHIWTKMEYIKF